MFQLTCRSRDWGRGLTPVAPVPGTPDPARSGLDHWTIWIHGFNNRANDAKETWSRTLMGLLQLQSKTQNIVLLYWPGDYGFTRAWSALNYPRTIPIALETAGELVRYLETVNKFRETPLELSFVAHSLGSLVVLETLRLIREQRVNINVREILLMAAAVPEGFCMPSENYGQRHGKSTAEHVLYSQHDFVLKTFFRPGQLIGGHFPTERRRAVGRTGGPGAGDGQRWNSAEHMFGFAHGDYWTSGASIDRIGKILGTEPLASQPKALPSIRSAALPVDILPSDPRFADLPSPAIHQPFTPHILSDGRD